MRKKIYTGPRTCLRPSRLLLEESGGEERRMQPWTNQMREMSCDYVFSSYVKSGSKNVPVLNLTMKPEAAPPEFLNLVHQDPEP